MHNTHPHPHPTLIAEYEDWTVLMLDVDSSRVWGKETAAAKWEVNK